jgi:acyl-CoA synthetase (AMP-forming)/AMP-acid ligase II
LDLENLMSQHEAVLESAAIGVPDEKWGERPLMVVTLKPEYKNKVSAVDLMTRGSCPNTVSPIDMNLWRKFRKPVWENSIKKNFVNTI